MFFPCLLSSYSITLIVVSEDGLVLELINLHKFFCLVWLELKKFRNVNSGIFLWHFFRDF